MTLESDSIARVTARDLFFVLRLFDNRRETTLENIRLSLCVDRKKPRKGNFLWSAARDISGELQRLGFVAGAPYAKDSKQYALGSTKPIRVTDDGLSMSELFRTDRAAGYDRLFCRMFASHPYLQAFVSVMKRRGKLLAPVFSSLKDHVSSRYGSTATLAEDVIAGEFDADAFFAILSQRLQRPLNDAEAKEVQAGLARMLSEAKASAVGDEMARFSKNFLNRLNDIVIPAVFRDDGLPFDYRTHRMLWTIGQEFLLWGVIRSHPAFDGWLMYPTATIRIAPNLTEIEELIFDSGLSKTREDFLAKLHDAYQKLQSLRGATFVAAWELRAVFCFDNRCQASVFDRLFAEFSGGSEDYRLHLEIQRQKPQHEAPLRASHRNIGSIRVVKR